MPDNVDSEAIYLYCFASSALLSTVEGMGVDGKNPVFLLPYRDVVAVAGFVAEGEFGSGTEGGMGDLAWVGPRACRHEEVVERAMRHSPVLPVPLGTIFDSHESLENHLRNQHDTIREFLEKVSGQDEWGVRGILNHVSACERYVLEGMTMQSGRFPCKSGRRRSEGRPNRSDGRKAMHRLLGSICQDLEEDLARMAADQRIRQNDANGLAVEDTHIVLNRAFLVPRDSASEFCARVRTANDECTIPGLFFELSGPWPPYSFCPRLGDHDRRLKPR